MQNCRDLHKPCGKIIISVHMLKNDVKSVLELFFSTPYNYTATTTSTTATTTSIYATTASSNATTLSTAGITLLVCFYIIATCCVAN